MSSARDITNKAPGILFVSTAAAVAGIICLDEQPAGTSSICSLF